MNPQAEVLLKVSGLTKYFPVYSGIFKSQVGEIKAVDGLDFSVLPGEILGLVGESGSGKSTAARAAIRLIEPTGGEALFKGENLFKMSSSSLFEVRRRIQMVFQDPFASLNPRKTIAETLGEPLLYHGITTSRSETYDKVAETLERVGLTPEQMIRYPHQFSGGQQQRICIGRALILSPELIVCDEALSALDISIQAQIINLLMELRKNCGLSYLFISHDLSAIRHLCDRVVVMYLGKVMESAETRELFDNPKHPYTQALLAAIPPKHPTKRVKPIPLKGEIPSPLHPPSGCPFRTRCPYAQPICAETPPRQVVGKDHIYHCIRS